MKNLFFVHIPRTGGSSFINFCKKLHSVKLINFNFMSHGKVTNDISIKHSNFLKVAFVRNPWSWVASHYCTTQYTNQFGLRKTSSSSSTYSQWKNCHEEKEWLNNLKNEKVNFKNYIKQFIENANNQSYYIMENGNMNIDFIGHYESLEKDVSKILNILDIKTEEKFPMIQNEGSSRKPFFYKTTDYVSFYNEETKNLIAENFKEDIQRFNYKF